MNIVIREASEKDQGAVYQVEYAAFNEADEAVLVEELEADITAAPRLSLLAWLEDQPIGHILFSKGQVQGHEQALQAAILAPLAVIPAYQKMGIGGLLIKAGLEKLKTDGVDLVFVLGHITYYPRHGFQPALPLGYIPPYPTKQGLEDAWMVQTLSDVTLGDYPGQVICAESFMRPDYW